MTTFSWTNFWVKKRKAKDRQLMIAATCHYFSMPVLAFRLLPLQDQDYLINKYKQAKGLS